MTISFSTSTKKLKAFEIYSFVTTEHEKFFVEANVRDSINYSFEICGQNVVGGKTKTIVQKDFVIIQLLPIVCRDISQIESQIYMYENSPCMVELYDDFLSVKYKDINICKKLLKDNIKINKNNYLLNINYNENKTYNYKIKIFDKKIKNNSILFICLENSLKKHFVILNDTNILFNNYLKEININDNLIILNDDINCLGEKTVFDFDFEKNCCQKYAVEYKNKIPPKDVAVTFLDAVKVCNQKLMKECLALDVDINALQEFLGEYDDFLKIEDCFILLNNFEITKAITLEIDDNKICNIYD